MTSNIDSEIIRNLKTTANQNTVEQTSFSSMVFNNVEIKGGNNTVTKTTKYVKQTPKEDKNKIQGNVKTILTKIDQTVYNPSGSLPPLSVLNLYVQENDRNEDVIISASKMEFFIGGDREPELIYTLPLQKVINGVTYEVNIRTIDVKLNNTGISPDDWIVSITWKYKIIPIPYVITEGFIDILTPNLEIYNSKPLLFKGFSQSIPNGTRLKQQTFSPFDLQGDISISSVITQDYIFNLPAPTLKQLLSVEFLNLDPTQGFRASGYSPILEDNKKDVVFNVVESTGRTFKASVLGQTISSNEFQVGSGVFFYNGLLVTEPNWTTYAVTISPKTTPVIQEYSFEASFVDQAIDEPTDRDYASSHSLVLLGYGAIQSIPEENYQNKVPSSTSSTGFRVGDRFFDTFPDNDLIKNQITEIFVKTPKLNESKAIPFIDNKIVSYSKAIEVHLGESWRYEVGGDGFVGFGTSDERIYAEDGTGTGLAPFPSRLGQAGSRIPLLSKYIEPSVTTFIKEDRLEGVPKPRSGNTIFQTYGAFEKAEEVGIAVKRFDREVRAFRNLADIALKDTRKNAEINIELVPRIKEDTLQNKINLQTLYKTSGFYDGELNLIQEIRQSYVGSFFVAEALFSIFALYPDLGSGDPDYLHFLADNPLYLTTGMWNYRKRSIDLITRLYTFQDGIIKDFSYIADLSLDSSLDDYYIPSGLPPQTAGIDNPTWLVKPNPTKPVTSVPFEGAEDIIAYSYEPICVNESEYSFFVRSTITNSPTGYIEEKCFVAFDLNGVEVIIPDTSFDAATDYKTQPNAVNISRWLELFKKGNLVDNYFYLTQWVEILDIPKDYEHPITLFAHEAFCIYPFVVVQYIIGTSGSRVAYRTVDEQKPIIALNNITFNIEDLDIEDTQQWSSVIDFCDPESVLNVTYARIEDPTASPFGVGQDNPIPDPENPGVFNPDTLKVVRAISKTDPKTVYIEATENPGSSLNTWSAIYEFNKSTFILSVVESNQFLTKEPLVVSKATFDLTNIRALDDNFYRERSRMLYK